MKSAEKDISRAEGLPFGKKFSGGSHESGAAGPVKASKFHPAIGVQKSNEGDQTRGEGLAMGKKKSGAAHDSGRRGVKDMGGVGLAAQAAYERAENGNPDSRMGE
jgi:hypothetical protein